MTSKKFAAGDWIDRLTLALRSLAEAQESYLPEYYGRSRRLQIVFGEQVGPPPAFPLDDVRTLYLMACHSHVWGQAEYYAALCAALDPVRVILRANPTLERVASPVIGQDEFWMEILKSGTLTSPTNMVVGLMARAAELSGNSFRRGAGELNAPPHASRGKRDGRHEGRARCRVRRGAFLRLDREGKDRHRERHGDPSFRTGAGVCGPELCGRACPVACSVSRLAVGRGGGQTVPVEADVAPNRLSRGSETEKSGTVFSGCAGLPGTSCRGARGTSAVHCRVERLHRPDRQPAPWSGVSR